LTPNTATGDRTYNLFAGSYNFGVAKLTAGYNTAKQERSTPAARNGKDKEYQVGVSAPFGAATVAAQYSNSKSDTTGNKGTGYSLLGTYDLSKRTRLYAGGKSEKFTGAGVAVTRASGVVAGVRHSF